MCSNSPIRNLMHCDVCGHDLPSFEMLNPTTCKRCCPTGLVVFRDPFHPWPFYYAVKRGNSEEVLAYFRNIEDAEWFATHRPPLTKDGYE